jgi:hypothetical protein
MIIRAAIIMSILTVLSVVLRFLAKRNTKSGFGADDCSILIAQTFWLVESLLSIKAALVGKKLTSIMDPNLKVYVKVEYPEGSFGMADTTSSTPPQLDSCTHHSH